MSPSAKAFFGIFVLLALGALGHDLYIWYYSDNYPFEFAALGWIAKQYYPDELQITIDTVGADAFNAILTPILQMKAFFLATGLAIFVYVVDFAQRKIKNMVPGRGKDRDGLNKFKKRVK